MSQQEQAPPEQGLTTAALAKRLGVTPRTLLRYWDDLGGLFANWSRAGRRPRGKCPDPEGIGWLRGLDGRFYPAQPQPGSITAPAVEPESPHIRDNS